MCALQNDEPVQLHHNSVALCYHPTSVIQRSACLPAGVLTRCYILDHASLNVKIMLQMPAEELSNIHFEHLSTHSMIRF